MTASATLEQSGVHVYIDLCVFVCVRMCVCQGVWEGDRNIADREGDTDRGGIGTYRGLSECPMAWPVPCIELPRIQGLREGNEPGRGASTREGRQDTQQRSGVWALRTQPRALLLRPATLHMRRSTHTHPLLSCSLTQSLSQGVNGVIKVLGVEREW